MHRTRSGRSCRRSTASAGASRLACGFMAIVERVDHHLHVALRLHEAAHHAERPDGLRRHGSGSRG